MIRSISKTVLFCSTLLFTTGCIITEQKIEDDIEPAVTSNYESGFFVVNQGTASSGNTDLYSSISFIDRENWTIIKDIYENTDRSNSRLSPTIFSMATHNGLGYIVSYENNKIDVIRLADFQILGSIYGLKKPRHFQVIDEQTAWVTQWGMDGLTGSIAVIDLRTNSIVNEIPTRKGPEKMLKVGDLMYVSNTGGFQLDSVISKIDIPSNSLEQTIQVGTRPQSFQIDQNGHLWVLSRGEINLTNPELNINGQLNKIVNDNLVRVFDIEPGAGNLSINSSRDVLYFTMDDAVYKHSINQNDINLAPHLDIPYVSIEVDPETNHLIGANPGNFVSDGKVGIHNASGTMIKEGEVGVIPIDFVIKN